MGYKGWNDRIIQAGLALLVVLLSACQTVQTPAAAATDAPTLARTPTQLPTATQVPTQAQSGILQTFPLVAGTSWTYMDTNYTQAENDPNTLLTATTQMVETILSSEQSGQYLFAKFHRSVTLVKADAGWDTARLGLGEFDGWYVVTDNKVYTSDDKPDAQTLKLDMLMEEYDFPMSVGASWCPNKQQKGYANPADAPAETPVPCASAGARTVQGVDAQHASRPAGNFDTCYRMSDFYNSGGVVQWFCDGVGIVAQKYDHLGSRFGYSSELVKFTRVESN